MTWDAYNRRKDALREVLAIADRRREEATASNLLNTVEGADLAFANEVDMLFDVQMIWFQRLSGQLDRTLSAGAEDLEIVVINAWADAAAQMPGARALLDANADLPELCKAFAKELEFLGRSAGIAGNRGDLIGHGQRLKEAARDDAAAHVHIREIPDTPAGLLARIREALAA